MSHKSAYLLRPTEFGNLFITYRFTKKITDLPGITLNVMEGPEHIDTDIRLGAADVYASSEERWMLEMMQQARTGKDGDIKKLQTFSSNLWGENFYELDAYLKECNAYDEPDVAKLRIIDRIGTKS